MTTTANQYVCCTQCGKEIGVYVQVGELVKIKIGTITFDHAWGRCECGQEWVWHLSDASYERLISRLESRRNLA